VSLSETLNTGAVVDISGHFEIAEITVVSGFAYFC